MKTIALTVLASEGPQARAYLARMRHAGLRPERIVLMVVGVDSGTRKPIGGWMPRGLRMAYAQRHQANRGRFWPRRLRAMESAAFERVKSVLQERCAGASAVLDTIVGGFDYQSYAARVDKVMVSGLGDPALAKALEVSEGSPTAVLFTGGGIVPPRLLDAAGVRLLHVHPGHLPNLRGADGLLWSLLLRGRPGMSCFYMAKGIDTGELIAVEDLPELAVPLSSRKRPDDEHLYQMIFSFIDPLLRAEFLVKRILETHTDLAAIPAQPQGIERGVTYHFIHPALRRVALQRLFVGEAA